MALETKGTPRLKRPLLEPLQEELCRPAGLGPAHVVERLQPFRCFLRVVVVGEHGQHAVGRLQEVVRLRHRASFQAT